MKITSNNSNQYHVKQRDPRHDGSNPDDASELTDILSMVKAVDKSNKGENIRQEKNSQEHPRVRDNNALGTILDIRV